MTFDVMFAVGGTVGYEYSTHVSESVLSWDGCF